MAALRAAANVGLLSLSRAANTREHRTPTPRYGTPTINMALGPFCAAKTCWTNACPERLPLRFFPALACSSASCREPERR